MKLRLVISDEILAKLSEKHQVNRPEVFQCFANKIGRSLIDPREEHRTDPPTLWFIAETDSGRELKVIYLIDDNLVFLKSAFPPNEDEKRIYKKHGLS